MKKKNYWMYLMALSLGVFLVFGNVNCGDDDDDDASDDDDDNDDDNAKSNFGGPCKINSDCMDPYACINGVCGSSGDDDDDDDDDDAGCKKDVDCKGDRVCVDGECVDQANEDDDDDDNDDDCKTACSGVDCGWEYGCDCGKCSSGYVCESGKCVKETDDDDDTTPECYNNSDCSQSDEICISSKCENMFVREYMLTIYSIKLTEKKENGDSWDSWGGAPDPFVKIYVDDDSIGKTKTVDDRYNATWDESFSVELFQSSEIVLHIYDEDVSDHDEIGGFAISGDSLEGFIKDGTVDAGGIIPTIAEFIISIEVK